MRKGNSSTARFNFGLSYDGTLYFRAGYSEGAGAWHTATPLPLNTWSHVAVTYSYGTGNQPAMYLNGVAQALQSLSAPVGSPVTDTPYLYLGHEHDFVNRAQSGFDSGFEGRMDNVRVYNSVLSAAAIMSTKSPEPEADDYDPIPFPEQAGNADTIEELLALIERLRQFIQDLLGSRNNVDSQRGTTPGNPACPLSASSRALARGMSGNDITQVQQFLIDRNYLAPGNATGYYGVLTEAAVKNFQCANNIVCSGMPESTGYGIVGSRTRAVMITQCNQTVSNPTPVPSAPASLSVSPTSGTVPLTATFSANGPDIGSYYLSYGDGERHYYRADEHNAPSFQVTHTYQNPGAYTVTLTTLACVGPAGPAVCTSQVETTAEAVVTVRQQPGVTNASCTFNGQTVAHGNSVTAYQSPMVDFGLSCYSQTRTCSNGALSGNYAYSSCTVGGTVAPQTCAFNGQTLQVGESVTAYSTQGVDYGMSCANYSQQRTCTADGFTGSYPFASCQSTGGGVAPLPESFTATPTSGLAPLEMTFVSSIHTHGTYYLSYGDGETLSYAYGDVGSGHPSRCTSGCDGGTFYDPHTYQSPGTYTATLQVAPACPAGRACTASLTTIGQVTVEVQQQQ